MNLNLKITSLKVGLLRLVLAIFSQHPEGEGEMHFDSIQGDFNLVLQAGDALGKAGLILRTGLPLFTSTSPHSVVVG